MEFEDPRDEDTWVSVTRGRGRVIGFEESASPDAAGTAGSVESWSGFVFFRKRFGVDVREKDDADRWANKLVSERPACSASP